MGWAQREQQQQEADEREVKDDYDMDMAKKFVLSPAVSGSLLLKAVTGAASASDRRKFKVKAHLREAQPDVLSALKLLEVSNHDLSTSWTCSNVEYADGDSEAESICDYDSGLGNIRWHRREQYFYRKETNLESRPYRRRMQLVVGKVGRDSYSLNWEAECESDNDDGYVNQQTF